MHSVKDEYQYACFAYLRKTWNNKRKIYTVRVLKLVKFRKKIINICFIHFFFFDWLQT